MQTTDPTNFKPTNLRSEQIHLNIVFQICRLCDPNDATVLSIKLNHNIYINKFGYNRNNNKNKQK